MKNKQAFTLIELLVVVLIIGILAAVALPQYQKAVYKSRAITAVSMLKALAQAQETYYMENGSYTEDWDVLSVDVPAELRTTWDTPKFDTKYAYACWSDGSSSAECGAFAQSANLPNFQIQLLNHPQVSERGKFWCHIYNNKNAMAKKICQSLGKEDTEFGAQYSWAAGKYFLLN